MSAFRFPRFEAPPPPPRPTCESCQTFAPEVTVPTEGDEVADLCWLCAHQVADHEVCVAHAHAVACQCARDKIYPADVVASLLSRSVVAQA